MRRNELVTLAARIAESGVLLPDEEASVLLQLAVTCARLGTPTGELSNRTIAEIFDIPSESKLGFLSKAITDPLSFAHWLICYLVRNVLRFTRRGIHAIGDIEALLLSWPTSAQRQTIRSSIGSSSSFKQCVGFLHMHSFKLRRRPTEDDERHFDPRRMAFTIKSVFVTDHLDRIRFASHGWPGGVSDRNVLGGEEVSAGCLSLRGLSLCYADASGLF